MEIGKLIRWNHVPEVGEVLISGEVARTRAARRDIKFKISNPLFYR